MFCMALCGFMDFTQHDPEYDRAIDRGCVGVGVDDRRNRFDGTGHNRPNWCSVNRLWAAFDRSQHFLN